MLGLRTRILVRLLIALGLITAFLASATASIPEDLPALAFQQPHLYRLEIALVVFYSCLLIITPALSGLAWGRLPTEISTRGAKFAEKADRSAGLDEAEIKKPEVGLKKLADGLGEVRIEIHHLKTRGDDK
jgi:hypothetical protein